MEEWWGVGQRVEVEVGCVWAEGLACRGVLQTADRKEKPT